MHEKEISKESKEVLTELVTLCPVDNRCPISSVLPS